MACDVFASEKVFLGLGKRKHSTLDAVDQEDAIASRPESRALREVVNRGDMEAVFNVLKSGNDELQNYCVKYLISLGSSGLVKVIKSASPYIKTRMLRVLVVHADQSLISKVFAEIKPTEDILCGVANNVDLTCMPDKFLHFLGTITDKETQENTLKNGLGALILANKTECIDTLIFALENETSLSVDLMNVAIHHAVLNASHSKDGRMLRPKRFFDHPAVSVDDYSDALYHFYKSEDPKNELFYWLLARADRQDLERVKKENWFLS